MSTYLFAFAIGEFVSKGGTTFDGLQMRVWAWPGMEDRIDEPVKDSIACFEALTRYNNFSFNGILDKVDHLALPDFEAGGMENWGLIIYDYRFMLFNPQVV